MNDEKYMRQALALAAEAEGETSPNPMVGAVIVNDADIIVGEGYHQKAGAPHAEINALRAAKGAARGCTVYVNLEPCAHFGRTAPCCDALIAAGVKRVVTAMQDPNPQVAGQGLQRLRAAGIEVTVGVCADEARVLNEKFLHWITTKMPFVALKFAMTLDGKITDQNKNSQWITGQEARTYAHYLRKTYDAVLVGKNTVLADDPELTTRLVQGKNPVRVILDSRAEIALNAKIFSGAAPTLLVTSAQAPTDKLAALALLPKVEVVQLPPEDGKLPLGLVLQELARRGLCSVLVEGGGAVHGAFLDAGIVDKVYAFIAPKLLGGARALTPIAGLGGALPDEFAALEKLQIVPLGDDVLLTGRVRAKETE